MAVVETLSNTDDFPDTLPGTRGVRLDASAVSWAAIVAGGIAAAALSLVLLLLGLGLGLATVSPWALDTVGSPTLAKSAIVWATVTQLLAAGLGGYLAGRLRTRWPSAPKDEVYFRDTAHGFLAWTVATLTTAILLVSPITSILGTGMQATVPATGAAAMAAPSTPDQPPSRVADQTVGLYRSGDPIAYYLNAMFRDDSRTGTAVGTAVSASTEQMGAVSPSATMVNPPGEDTSASAPAPPIAEVGLIFMNALSLASLPAHDARYVAQLVARHTGLTEPEAEVRVNDAYTRAQDALLDAEITARAAADTARRIRTEAAIWLFIALLAGAFVSSWLAIYGGRQRDH